MVEGYRESSELEDTALMDTNIKSRLQAMMNGGCSPSSAARQVSQDLGIPRNRVYDLATKLKR